MKRDLMQFGIEVGAILLIGFVALAVGGCSNPTEPRPRLDGLVFVQEVDIHGVPIVDTIGWDGFFVEPEHVLEQYPITQARGTWIMRTGAIRDPWRDTTAY